MQPWQPGGALTVFSGARRQRGFGRFRTQTGNGLGGIFRRLFRSAVPYLIRGGKEVGREALKTGVAIGEDLLSGKNIKTATASRLREAAGNMKQKAISRTQSNMQSGNGKRIKRKDKVKTVSQSKKPRKANTPKSKTKKKLAYSDIFGN
jgi:hypothetical protein